MKVHYPKLYNMAHLSLNVFTASKGSNNYILFSNVSYMYLMGKRFYYLKGEETKDNMSTTPLRFRRLGFSCFHV